MKRILIATDGSPAAVGAVTAGLELAVASEAEVTFIHVLPPDEFLVTRFGRDRVISHHVDVDEAETVLTEAAEAAEAAGVSYALERVSGGTVDEIIAVAKAKGIDLIVLGSRGRGTVSGTLLGSVSMGVLRKAGQPVLVVKATAVAAEVA